MIKVVSDGAIRGDARLLCLAPGPGADGRRQRRIWAGMMPDRDESTSSPRKLHITLFLPMSGGRGHREPGPAASTRRDDVVVVELGLPADQVATPAPPFSGRVRSWSCSPPGDGVSGLMFNAGRAVYLLGGPPSRNRRVPAQ
jgi:hypothetical protein